MDGIHNNANAFDPWAGEAEVEWKIFQGSTDKHGHYDRIGGIKVPQGTSGEVGVLVARVPEFRTQGDFIRTAIAWAIQIVQREYGDDLPPGWGESAIQQMIAADTVNRFKGEHQMLEDYRFLMREAKDPRSRAELIVKIMAAAEAVQSPEIADELRRLT